MVKKLSFITFLLIMSACIYVPTGCFGSVAVDWQALGFPTKPTSSGAYDQTMMSYHVKFTPKNKDELGVFDPVILHSITGGGTPPITNSSLFPAFDVNVTANTNNPKLEVIMEGTTNFVDYVLAPGEYLFLGGFDTNAITSIDQFQFSALGGGSVDASNFVATTTYEVNSTDADALTWDPIGAELTYVPSMGTTGVIFLRNDSGLYIDSIKFDVNYSADTSFYFGLTSQPIPEPSTYLTLAGMTAICLAGARYKRKRL